MPNLANAKKALRQDEKRTLRNTLVKEEIHSMRRAFRKLMEAGKLDEAKAMIPNFDKLLDKSVTKHVFKKNKAARIKSRLVNRLNKAMQK